MGLSSRVFEEFCELVDENYHQPVDYFDLRSKAAHFENSEVHLIYDETDLTIPFEKGMEMRKAFTQAKFVHAKGLGHYKIISHHEILSYVRENLK